MKQMKLFVLLLCLALTVSLFAACGKMAGDNNTTASAPESTTETAKDTTAAAKDLKDTDDTSGAAAKASAETTKATPSNDEGKKEMTDMEYTKVKFTMENGGTFTMELYPEYAPKTVENFIGLVKSGYYSGTKFHRVYPGFMAQGGEGADTPSIKGEFASNGFAQNTLSHTRGVVSMARTTVKDSASSQFFICYGDATFLDGDYAAFGKVIDGMDTVDAFCDIERVGNGFDRVATSPVEDIVIASAEIV